MSRCGASVNIVNCTDNDMGNGQFVKCCCTQRREDGGVQDVGELNVTTCSTPEYNQIL